MARNPLTPVECTQILNLRKTGSSLAKIAKEMHRAKNTIAEFLKNPDGYLNGSMSSYSEQKPSPRKGAQEFIRVDYQKYEGHEGGSGEPAATNDGAFNKVSFEHQAVIKFLSKLGKENTNILEDMNAVYEDDCPNIECINYWVEEFKNGRKLVLFPDVEPKRGRGRPKSKHTTPVRKRMWVKSKSRTANSPKITKPSKGRYRHQETKKKQGKVLGKSNIQIKRLGSSKKLLKIKLPALKKLMDLK